MKDATNSTLAGWLAHCDSLQPLTFEDSLERVSEVRRRLGTRFAMPLISVAGTNGKGSTCAMLESIALQAGYRVGLYQKPELVDFEERCRIGGAPVSAEVLLPHFEAVERARGEILLNRFEFTTLVIAHALSQVPLDLVILEVGIGGRFDAVNAFDADCAILTSIDLDHMAILGPDRESIGLQKAHIMRPGHAAVVSDPLPPQSVIQHAQDIGADLWRVGRDFRHQGDRQQWSWSGRHRRYNALAFPALRGANQLLNASGVLAAFEALEDRLPITAQAVRQGLALVDLPGRFQIIPGQPTVILDVAHNAQAVSALALNLDQMGFAPRTHAVLGAMRDKSIADLFARMAPLVDHWHVCDLPTPRAASAQELADHFMSLGQDLRRKATVQCHASPVQALQVARETADPADRIVVFGSFYTVGGVLKGGLNRPWT